MGENMALKKIEKQDDGSLACPECGKLLRVQGDNPSGGKIGKQRFICDECRVYYMSVMATDNYMIFPLVDVAKSGKAQGKEHVPSAEDKPEGKGPIALPKVPNGDEKCPVCGNPFRFVEGGAVRVVNGQVDLENVKPKYECDACGVFYREVLTSGFYLPFPQQEEDKLPAASSEARQEDGGQSQTGEAAAAGREPIALPKTPTGKEKCPVCGELFRFVDGGAVRVVNGQADMENIKPKYECDKCGVFYREVLTSGFYTAFPQEEEDKVQPKAKPKKQSKKKSKKLRSTGDLAPMVLKRDENNQCQCPRCGEMMDYVEGQAVRLVDGKPDMDNVAEHFKCGSCGSVFRKIVNTDYYQFAEK